MDEKLAWWRRIALSVLCVGLTWWFLVRVDKHYAIEDWLFWHYLRAWTMSIAMGLACLGVGELVVQRLVGRIRGLHAHLFVSFCTGLLVFGIAVFAAGMLQLYSTGFFYGLPLTMLALSGRRLFALRHELWPRVQRHAPLRLRGPWAIVVFVFGMYAFLMIYAFVLTPHNVSFDARWMHVAIAESFATHGGIFRYPEGWMVAARPHFASYLYTWAFLLPDSELFDRIVLCGHIEFVVFAMTTMLGIPAMVRRLVPRANPTLVWVSRFLFPGVFLYDSNLSIGADHIAATFAIPIFLVTHDFVRRGLGPRWGVMVALMTGAMLLTKEAGAMMTIPMAGVVVVLGAARAAWRARGKGGPFFDRHRWILGLLAIAFAGLVISSPLWLKNVLWYGDPLYPTTHQYFWPRPWAPDADYMFEWGYMDYQFDPWVKTSDTPWKDSLEILYKWSVVPHDWSAHHGKRPVIGSLVTLLLPCLLLLRRTKWLWIAAVWIHVGILVWFRLLPQDRYLQVLMPWMAAFTAGTLALMWRGRVRVFAVLLVGTQIVWGGDVYFLHRNVLPHVIDLFKASRKEKTLAKRMRTQGAFQTIGEHMPAGSRLLMHEVHPHLGVNVPTHHDFQTWQYGLSYGLMKSPRELWQTYRDMGITHLFWGHHRSRSWDSVAGDIMFFDLALRYSLERKKFGGAWVAKMPEKAPPDEEHFEDTALVLGCGKRGFASGLYRVRDLHVPMFGPDAQTFPEPRLAEPKRKQAIALAESATYVVVDPVCVRGIAKELPTGFKLAVKRPRIGKLKNRGYHIYMRLRGKAKPWPSGDAAGDAADENKVE